MGGKTMWKCIKDVVTLSGESKEKRAKKNRGQSPFIAPLGVNI